MVKSVRANALAATSEQVVVGITFFVFYGALIRLVGAELVGVLSLVLVLASIVSMTSAGFASTLAHHVPIFESRGERRATAECIDTTIICTAVLYLAILAVAYFPFRAMIAGQAGPGHGALVEDLMIPAVVQVLLSGLGSATTLALTALQRSDLRFYANLLGAAVGLATLALLAPRLGVVAGLWGMAAQSGTIVLLTWAQLIRLVPDLGPVPRRWSSRMARRLFSLGANMQLQTLLVAAVEPITRLLIGAYGSLASVAFFSMASRYVLQTRALIYAGAQPLVAGFSHARMLGPEAFMPLYDRAGAFIGVIAILTISAGVGAAPFVGELWIGVNQPDFVVFSAMLGAGWLANTLTLPAYFNAYSLGDMRHSLIGHIVLLGLTVALGFPLVRAFGAVGGVAGMALALAISALYLGTANSRLAPGRRFTAYLGSHIFIVISATLGAAAAIAAYYAVRGANSVWLGGLASGASWLVLLAPAILAHPAVRSIAAERLTARLNRRTG